MAKQSKAVNSSAIRLIEWDDETQQMDVTFANGGTYNHFNVPQEAFQEFVDAPSPGSHWHRYIKGNYE